MAHRSLGGETIVVRPEVRRMKPFPPLKDVAERIMRPLLGLLRGPYAKQSLQPPADFLQICFSIASD